MALARTPSEHPSGPASTSVSVNEIRVGFIGLGIMGRRIVMRLLNAGYEVHGHTRTAAKADDLVKAGMHLHGSVEATVVASDVVLSALPDETAVRSVSRAVLAAARPGQRYVEHSTISPPLAVEVARRAIAVGVDYLDAPVSGGPAGAEAGTLTIMIGGEVTVMEDLGPLLETFGERIRHCGPTGSGQSVKLVNQLLVAIHTAASAEAAVFAAGLGLDLDTVLEVVGASFGGSVMLARNLPRIGAADFSPATPSRLIAKDLEMICSEAASHDVGLRLGELAQQLFHEAAERGMAEDDMAGIVRLWDGLDLPSATSATDMNDTATT